MGEDVPLGARSQLAEQQKMLAERYRKVEELLLRLADVEAAENPERAALLRRAAKQASEQFILDRLQTAAGALSNEQYQDAIENQNTAREQLAALLKLLQSEDRPQRIREEKERINNWIRDLKRMERSERATRARTENGADLQDVAEEQRLIEKKASEVEAQLREENQGESAERSSDSPDGPQSEKPDEKKAPSRDEGGLQETDRQEEDTERQGGDQEKAPTEEESPAQDKIDKNDSEGRNDSDEQQKDEQSGESQESPGSEQSEKAAGETQGENANKQEEASNGSQDQPTDADDSSSESEASESGQSQQPQPSSPKEAAQRAVEKARQQMQEAQKRLEKAQRDEAVEAQRQAEEELRDAIEKLERILRQLREEEMLRELARLESRLRQMAQMQSDVLDRTKELAATPVEQRDRQTDIRAGNLAIDEKKILLEADRAILLLREEGSSVAFPEVVQQMRGDMERVADRLAETKIDEVTQGIQEDVLAALEEMIGALQQAQRDLEQQQQQQQQQQQAGNQGEQPLVQPLAELKLLRTMQTRIKGTTERYGKLIPGAGEGTVDSDLLELLQDLSSRQLKLYQVTRDLQLRRNQ